MIRKAIAIIRRQALVEQLRASLWFVPALFVGVAVGGAAALSRIDVEETSLLGSVVFPGGAESARAILQAIAGSVITVTGVVFSLTVVTLQLASTQFSPRLLRTFLRDISNQIVLGTFLATFTYSLVVLRGVESGGPGRPDSVPTLAVTGAYVLVGASVVALVYFIDHIARSIRIDSLMREVNEDTMDAIQGVAAAESGHTGLPGSPPPPETAHVVSVPKSGFVQAVDDRRLLRVATRHDVVIQIAPMTGERVIAGAPLAWIWPSSSGRAAASTSVVRQVARSVQVGYERTMQQDVAFGFRQLVDVAVKALSPGVNDPTTAVHAVGHLAALLTRVSSTPLGRRILLDGSGTQRVIAPGLEFTALLDLSCGQIRRFGAAEPAVTGELLRMLLDVARADQSGDHADALRREAAMIVDAAERTTPEPRDLEALHQLHAELHAVLAGKS